MNKTQVVKTLRDEERRLLQELKQVKLALDALKASRQEAVPVHSKHVFTRRIAGVCVECKQPYKAKKTGTRFCTPRCRSLWWTREHARQEQEVSKPAKPKAAVLVPGDPLRAGH
jgi:hypothetical protein